MPSVHTQFVSGIGLITAGHIGFSGQSSSVSASLTHSQLAPIFGGQQLVLTHPHSSFDSHSSITVPFVDGVMYIKPTDMIPTKSSISAIFFIL